MNAMIYTSEHVTVISKDNKNIYVWGVFLQREMLQEIFSTLEGKGKEDFCGVEDFYCSSVQVIILRLEILKGRKAT